MTLSRSPTASPPTPVPTPAPSETTPEPTPSTDGTTQAPVPGSQENGNKPGDGQSNGGTTTKGTDQAETTSPAGSTSVDHQGAALAHTGSTTLPLLGEATLLLITGVSLALTKRAKA